MTQEQAAVVTALSTLVYAIAASFTLLVIGWAAYYARGQLSAMAYESRRNLMRSMMETWMDERMARARRLARAIASQRSEDREATGHEPEILKRKLIEMEEANEEDLYALMLLPHFFEFVSVLIGDSRREKELFATLFQATVIHYYKLFEAWIMHEQERYKLPELYVEFRRLFEFCRQREKAEK